MGLIISDAVRAKLTAKHQVREDEIEECFSNIEGKYLKDTRDDHKTDPETQWFIASTNYGRLLKVVFMLYPDGSIHIKSAFEPNSIEKSIYNKYAK